MSQSLVDVILHIVFSTKDRQPLIKPDIEENLYQYISGIGRKIGCPIIMINGVEDHVHILLQFDKIMSISKLVSEIKSNSSRWIKTNGNHYKDFSWQGGYGGFAVSRINVEAAKKYLSIQKEHHKTITFKEEFLKLLKHANIPYNDKFLWD